MINSKLSLRWSESEMLSFGASLCGKITDDSKN